MSTHRPMSLSGLNNHWAQNPDWSTSISSPPQRNPLNRRMKALNRTPGSGIFFPTPWQQPYGDLNIPIQPAFMSAPVSTIPVRYHH